MLIYSCPIELFDGYFLVIYDLEVFEGEREETAVQCLHLFLVNSLQFSLIAMY